MNARYQQPVEMDSVEVPTDNRNAEKVDMGISGHLAMKIGSQAIVKVGSEHMGVMGEDEVQIST